MGVNKFLQAVMGPNAQTRTSTTTQTPRNSNSSPAATGARASIPSRAGRTGETGNAVIVRPKIIDFGEVYPGLSAPILLTISRVKGTLVKGSLRQVETWLAVTQKTFGGMRETA